MEDTLMHKSKDSFNTKDTPPKVRKMVNMKDTKAKVSSASPGLDFVAEQVSKKSGGAKGKFFPKGNTSVFKKKMLKARD
jgi:hypothetical protein